MTNLEALQSLVHLDLPLLHKKVLLDNGVNESDTYTIDNKDLIELCSAYVYKVELSHPNFSEGKLSISPNREALEKLMNSIFLKNNLKSETTIKTPTIKVHTL